MRSARVDALFPLIQKGLPLLFSCGDDVLLLVLSKLGVRLPGLHLLSTGLLLVTLGIGCWRVIQRGSRRYSVS